MKTISILLALVASLLFVDSVAAQCRCANCRTRSVQFRGLGINYSRSVAQSKAQTAAFRGRKGHIGGSMGAGRFEGVGWSTVSAQSAIRNCCYWGRRTPVDIGVARGRDGWYACVLYR